MLKIDLSLKAYRSLTTDTPQKVRFADMFRDLMLRQDVTDTSYAKHYAAVCRMALELGLDNLFIEG